MKRNLDKLAETEFDLVIIGGGIYGACAAWDAALRGLSVAVIDQDDFGSATSSNSLKIIHGGLRYLQHADFKRMRESIRERRTMMEIAPHLIHPLPCLMPTYGHGLKGRELMAVALFMNDVVGFDRNRINDPQKVLPRGRVVPAAECQEIIPGIDETGLTGGAIWYDCQVQNSERLLLSFLLGAEQNGAQAANYLKVTGFMIQDNRVTGVKAVDRLNGTELQIRAKLTINNSGPWVNSVLGLMNGKAPAKKVLLSKAMNLVLKRQLIPEYAVGIPSRFEFVDKDAVINKGSRLLFITPWRDVSIVGTTHVSYSGDPDGFRVTEDDVQSFVDELAEAYPAANLTRDDVSFAYGGLLPMDHVNQQTGDVNLMKQYSIIDHEQTSGLQGFLTVVGVKYTTARDVAEKSVDIALRKLGRAHISSPGRETVVYGGEIARFRDYLTAEMNAAPANLAAETIRHLICNHGSEYREILRYVDEDPDHADPISPNSKVIRAEVIHAVREEMALRLCDVVRRRTELGATGDPGEQALQSAAEIMARELGWNQSRIRDEISETRKQYSFEP